MCDEKLKIAIPAPIEDVPNYIAALKALDAEPILVDADCDAADFDGLLLPGGVDVDPARYGQENTACGPLKPELDAWQFAVTDAFVKLKKPIFGICRGHQLINVYFGGTLIQHIEYAKLHARDPGTTIDKVHVNSCEAGSYLAELYGTAFSTNSSHHQAVDRAGDRLRVVMHSPEGYVEGMFHEQLPIWSIQWHPERMCFAYASDAFVDGALVLKWFLEQCAKAKRH